jgi:carbon-monoxide dehydrogenase medium subunit
MINDLEYFAPKEEAEALELLGMHGSDAKIIAGGQSLLILLRQGLISPAFLIDIKGLSALNYLRASPDGGLAIGALATHRAIETSELVRNGFGVLCDMERNLASVETRNWGTLGGNLSHADPASDPTPVLIALNASATLRSLRGERTVAVEDFSTGFYETLLEEDELLAEIAIPKPAPRTATRYRKTSHISGDHALASVAVSVTLDGGGVCRDARVVLGAVNSIPTRAKHAEDLLRGMKLDDGLLQQATEAAAEEADPVSDMHASAEYRRELIAVLARQLIDETWRAALEA